MDVDKLGPGELLELLGNLSDNLGHLLVLLGLPDGFNFTGADLQDDALSLLVLLDGFGHTEFVEAEIVQGGEEGNLGLLVIPDNLVVVAESFVDVSDIFFVLTAVDSVVGFLGGLAVGSG